MGAYVDAPIATRFIMAAVGAFGGLLPDIDTASSMLGRFLPKLWHEMTPGHRGITHSLLYCGIVYALAIAAQSYGDTRGLWQAPDVPYAPLALLAGMLTHLLADGMTEQGVPLLYPFTKHRFRLLGPLSFTNESKGESVALTLLLSLSATYLLAPYSGRYVSMIDLPTVLSAQPEQVVVYAVTFVSCVAVLSIYRRSTRSRPRKRRRKSRRK